MKQYLYILSIFIISIQTYGQMNFSTLKHNFGDLQSYDNRFIDITIKNDGVKDGYILSVRKPIEVVFIQSNALVKKDSTMTLRFQVNPPVKGKFSYTVEIYTSDRNEPHKLVLTGNLLEVENSSSASMTSCPDFNTHPIGRKANQFDLTVITIDAETRKEIEQTSVSLIQDGFAQWTEKTDKAGKIKKPGTIGMAYIYASKNGYFPAEKGAFINLERNRVVIELRKKPQSTTSQTDEELIVSTPTQQSTEIEIDLTEKPILKEQTTISTIEKGSLKLEDLNPDDFNDLNFKPINVVFVLDVSSSMNQGDKMELMKFSLNQLTEMLREQDLVSLVTYSSRAQVLLPPTKGSEKDIIKEKVKGLRLSGMTAGGQGIKMGYEEVLKKYLENGVNHVFVLTDGAFNEKNYDYKKLIKTYKKRGITLSVVGIVNDQKSEVSMRSIASEGGGEYIPVFKLIDAQQNIRQAIRRMAFTK